MRLPSSAKMRLLSSFSPPPVTPPTNPNTNSSTVLFARNIIIVIAIMFFICGLLHLLVRYLIKKKRLLSLSSRFQETVLDDDDDAYQRQLQQLFNLHDSGLDQALIDALPVFSYKELMGLKEPFDCAVCLCEFTSKDNLRLLPLCSHAFHMNCIDTWLLSNSTCPLCRGKLFTHGFSVENPVFEVNSSRDEEGEERGGGFGQGYFGNFGQRHFGNFGQKEGGIGNEKKVYSRDEEGGERGGDFGQGYFGNFRQGHFGNFGQKEGGIGDEKKVYSRDEEGEERGGDFGQGYFGNFGQGHFGNFGQKEGGIGNEKKVYEVRLGKFRTSKEVGETSNGNFDARRCYSMGSYEYVVRNLDLKVELSDNKGSSCRGIVGIKEKGNGSIDGGSDGKKISSRSKGESFSISKIWLWSKKDHGQQKSQPFSSTHLANEHL